MDDRVIFYEADVGTNCKVQPLLNTYGQVLGQLINFYKTAMVFSKNTPINSREEIRAIWTNGTVQQYKRYLGLLS